MRGVIPWGAVLQAERGISQGGATAVHAKSLGPQVKARAFGMTPWLECSTKECTIPARI
jgi:hypothetical protein